MTITAFFEKNIGRPPFQAAIVLAAGLLFMTIGWVLALNGVQAIDRLFAWTVATAFALLFAIFNSLISLRAASSTKYWGASVYSYMALALCSGTAAWQFSGIPIREAGTYRWIFLVVTFGFLVFLSMVNFMKKIVQFAEREEWNQPRKRR
ncbi:MAG TPA: hypothetical protein PLO67_20150 [Saprospiraceae bacterium]|nr:hypothetical protein [Saprospiraceae bacterium]HPI08566.1 hypothetical protein [Saprospiraceae bacterium]